MKKWIKRIVLGFFVLVILFVVIVMLARQLNKGDSVTYIPDLILKDRLYFKNGEVKPYTGKSVAFIDDTIISERMYVNGIADGPSIDWHKNGQKKSEVNYVNGDWHGKRVEWFDNGNKESESDYVDDENMEMKSFWFANGQIKAKHIFKNEVVTEYQSWYEDGSNECSGEFGVESGEKKCWYENGMIKSLKKYGGHSDDMAFINNRDGTATAWHRNGQKKSEGEYVKDRKQGKWISWDENGNVISEKHYEKGKLVSNK